MALGIQSCGSDDDLPGGGTDLPTISENKILEGTKWTNRTFDFEVADDVSWAYWFTEITNIYFYSNREGAFYYSRKSDYSDTGAHSERQVCFFTYKVDNSNSVVELKPLNYECDGFSRYLKLRGGNIVLDDQAMTKGDISSSDMAWINSITGVTGDCKWYYDMKKVLSIVGNGDMENYTSYNRTPWGSRNITYNDIYLSDGVTSIGDWAFADPALGIVEIYNCDKIKTIGKGAFKGSCIRELDMPYSLAKIGDEAFSGCKYLSFDLYGDIEEIGSYAFSDCKKVSFLSVDKLRVIGDGAFSGTSISYFNKAEALEKIGRAAIDIDDKQLQLPAIKELRPLAVTGDKLDEIHIGHSLAHVEGTPFFGAESGKFYINQSTPLRLTNDIVDNPGGWTLYVPEGSESRYRQAEYWKNFKSINGSSSLDDSGDGGDSSDDSEVDVLEEISAVPKAFGAEFTGIITAEAKTKFNRFELTLSTTRDFAKTKKIEEIKEYPNFSVRVYELQPNQVYYYRIRCISRNSPDKYSEVYTFETTSPKHPSSCSYTIDGVTFKMVKVTGLSTGDFYIMQTEIPPACTMTIDGYSTVKLDKNGDKIIIQSEFRDFLDDIRFITDIPFRLPTKNEWIYAAKGGQLSRGYKYSGSDNLAEVGWYNGNSTNAKAPGLLKPNELDLYDMSGNYNELVFNPIRDEYNVDGDLYGGWYNCSTSKCTPDSYETQPQKGKIPGSSKKNELAFECKHSTVRLVYSAE